MIQFEFLINLLNPFGFLLGLKVDEYDTEDNDFRGYRINFGIIFFEFVIDIFYGEGLDQDRES